jgi:hypothetical protein
MSLLPFFQWCYATGIGETIRESTWLFPVIEAFHLLGLGLTAGSVLLVDLRLLGAGLNGQPVIPLFLSEAIKCYYSFPFWVKMTSLLLALIFTFTLRRRVTRTDVAAERPLPARLTGLISICLWFGVAWGGRWIGFS